MIDHVGVVVPARDEEESVGRCLESVLASVADARAHAHPDLTVSIVLVADGCRDRTAAIADSFADVHVIELDASNVGIARAVGCRWAVQRGAQWLAHTDADSVVPRGWIRTQLALAADGADVAVGTVRPDFEELSGDRRWAWERSHVIGVANGHVHGANLGVRVSSYLDAGGFAGVEEHEDVDLVDRLAAAGATVVPFATAEVLTSARLVGRTPGGYARYLRDDLVAESAP